jgi:hypothetical protein
MSSISPSPKRAIKPPCAKNLSIGIIGCYDIVTYVDLQQGIYEEGLPCPASCSQ